MRITSKGQVTIPAHIRRRAGFNPNVEVEFVWEDGKVVLKAADRLSRGQRTVAVLSAAKIDLGMTVDEYMEMIRGPYEDLEERPAVHEATQPSKHR